MTIEKLWVGVTLTMMRKSLTSSHHCTPSSTQIAANWMVWWPGWTLCQVS